MTRRYIIGFEITGHFVIEAGNPQAAAAEALGLVRAAVRTVGGNDDPTAASAIEYKCPFGDIVVAGDPRRSRRGL